MNHVRHPLSSDDISIFLPEIRKFCCIKKYRYRLHFDTEFLIFLTLFESLKIFSIIMVIILTMSAKIATLNFFKLKLFWKKNFEVIIYIYDTTNTITNYKSESFYDYFLHLQTLHGKKLLRSEVREVERLTWIETLL